MVFAKKIELLQLSDSVLYVSNIFRNGLRFSWGFWRFANSLLISRKAVDNMLCSNTDLKTQMNIPATAQIIAESNTKTAWFDGHQKMNALNTWRGCCTPACLDIDGLDYESEVHVIYEIMNQGPHYSPFARLPLVGGYSDWEGISRLGIRLEWQASDGSG